MAEDFFKNSMDDSIRLFSIFKQIINQTNTLLSSALDLPDYLLFSEERFPRSTGKLVSEIFLTYLFY
jgi:hypothetical protein